MARVATAFDRPCIPADRVAIRSHTPGMLPNRALSGGRRNGLGARGPLTTDCYLHSDFILPLRHTVRTALDRHASMSPDGKSWVDVQRDTSRGHFGAPQGRAVFLSRGHRAHRELLACVESASRSWWVQCSQLPNGGWHHDIVFGILDMFLGWLVRLVPMLEEQYVLLPAGPVAFRVRFSAIETFRQRDNQVTEPPVAPAVAVEDGEIAIDCVPGYLRCFLNAGNLGDRLMIGIGCIRWRHSSPCMTMRKSRPPRTSVSFAGILPVWSAGSSRRWHWAHRRMVPDHPAPGQTSTFWLRRFRRFWNVPGIAMHCTTV